MWCFPFCNLALLGCTFLICAAMRAPEGLAVLATCTDDRLQRVDPIAYMPGVIARAGDRQPTTCRALAQRECAFCSVGLVPHFIC